MHEVLHSYFSALENPRGFVFQSPPHPPQPDCCVIFFVKPHHHRCFIGSWIRFCVINPVVPNTPFLYPPKDYPCKDLYLSRLAWNSFIELFDFLFIRCFIITVSKDKCIFRRWCKISSIQLLVIVFFPTIDFSWNIKFNEKQLSSWISIGRQINRIWLAFTIFCVLIFTLTHFMPLFFYTPWKHQKTSGFLMFQGV